MAKSKGRKIFGILLILSYVSVPLCAQNERFLEDYLERLENAKKYTLLVAEMMPEEDFNYKATEESLSFAEHLMHIGWAMDWHSQSLMGGRAARDWETDTELKVADKTKAEMIEKIGQTFDRTIVFLQNFDLEALDAHLDYFGLERSKRQVMLLLADHITHHRAQMLVYLRLKGIKPPRYVLYQ